MSARHLARAFWLGRRSYGPMHELQRRLVDKRREGVVGDVILLLEHDPVITLGRNADPNNVLVSREGLSRRGVELFETGRGGDVTYHGPGQLVGYPILDLKPDRRDVRRYVRNLAQVMIEIAADHGVECGTVPDHVGVWADPQAPDRWAGPEWADEIQKLGAIGVRISRWITMHGFAMNVATALDAFELIVPCGIREHGVTSLSALASNFGMHELPLSVARIAMQSRDALARALDWEIEGPFDLSEIADAQLEEQLCDG